MEELCTNSDALRRDGVRRDQMDYRKWIVSLATFVLTVSLGLIGLISGPLAHQWLLVLGWSHLGLCIFLNWLLIKRLVGISLVAARAEQDPALTDLLDVLCRKNVQWYALIQNLAFLIGVSGVGLGFVFNL